MTIPHIPVLLNQTVELFKKHMKNEGYFIDCTLGFGGHSEAILETFNNVKLIGIDQDSDALNFAKERLKRFSNRVEFINKRASLALEELEGLPISGLLADIGVSSYQLDNKQRGFTFESDLLDMRMDKTQNLSAKEVINHYSQLDLERIIKHYGECKRYKRVVNAIISKRPIKSNREFADILGEVGIKDKKSLAKIFQAIRIEVNNELNELEKILENSKKIAKKGTILSIITFHSLEDRIVKNTFREWSKKCICPPEAIRCECGGDNEIGEIITKKPIVADKKEIQQNPRSRSAKLRGFKFKGFKDECKRQGKGITT